MHIPTCLYSQITSDIQGHLIDHASLTMADIARQMDNVAPPHPPQPASGHKVPNGLINVRLVPTIQLWAASSCNDVVNVIV